MKWWYSRTYGEEVTSDDFIEAVGVPDQEHKANARNNAVGSMFREMHARGVIELAGRTVRSRQPHRKGGMIQVWRVILVTARPAPKPVTTRKRVIPRRTS
jgi:hypothetical protein